MPPPARLRYPRSGYRSRFSWRQATRIRGPSSRARLPQLRGQLVDLGGAQFVGDPVGDEAGGALDDLLAHLEFVLFQGAAGGDEVDDAVGEAAQRRQLDRPLDFDHFDLAAGRL